MELSLVLLITFFMYRIIPMFIDLPVFSKISNDVIYTKFIKQEGVSALFTGIIFAKYNTMDRVKERTESIKKPIRILLMFFITVSYIFLRAFDGMDFFDFLLPPFYIVLCLSVISISKVCFSIFQFLGKHSKNMWLVHSFYCYRFSPFVKIVYGTGNALIALAILIGLSLITSIVLDYFYLGVSKLKYLGRKNIPSQSENEV